jgi:glutamate-1-semialdehyde 2,1-aminomutase
MNTQCAEWARSTNLRLGDEALPVRVVHLGTIWTVLFTEPGRYNWLLQYYLRAEGVTLSWVGTGRCLSKLVTDPLTDIIAYFPRRQRA